MKIKRIPVSELQLGMYIHKLGEHWFQHDFWRSRFLLERQKDLDRILASRSVREVWINPAKGTLSTIGPAGATQQRDMDRLLALLHALDTAGLDDLPDVSAPVVWSDKVFEDAGQAPAPVLLAEDRSVPTVPLEVALHLVPGGQAGRARLLQCDFQGDRGHRPVLGQQRGRLYLARILEDLV